MKYCVKCKQKYPDHAVKCNRCNVELRKIPPSQNLKQQQAQQANQKKTTGTNNYNTQAYANNNAKQSYNKVTSVASYNKGYSDTLTNNYDVDDYEDVEYTDTVYNNGKYQNSDTYAEEAYETKTSAYNTNSYKAAQVEDEVAIKGGKSILARPDRERRKSRNIVGTLLKIVAVFLSSVALACCLIKAYEVSKIVPITNPADGTVIDYGLSLKTFLFNFAMYFGVCLLFCGILFALAEIIKLLQKVVDNQEDMFNR